MATCKDCIHYDICKDIGCDEHYKDKTSDLAKLFSPEGCTDFKNKADVVEVVRCKDCKYYHNSGYCTRIGMSEDRFANDYCSYGERKENEK